MVGDRQVHDDLGRAHESPLLVHLQLESLVLI